MEDMEPGPVVVSAVSLSGFPHLPITCRRCFSRPKKYPSRPQSLSFTAGLRYNYRIRYTFYESTLF